MFSIPNTLIITSWAPPMTGAPQYLYYHLKDINPDNISVLTSHNDLHYSGMKKTGTPLECKYFFYDNFDFQNADVLKSSYVKNQQFNFKKQTKIYKLKIFIRNIFRNTILVKILVNFISIINIKNIFIWIKVAKKLIIKQNIKIIIGISDIGPALISSYLTAKMTKSKLVIYLFDLYYTKKLPLTYKILAKLFEKKIYNYAKIIIVTNIASKNYLINHKKININKICIINNSVPNSYYEKIRFKNKSLPFTLVYTGNIYWAQEKPIIDTIRAINLLNNKNIQFHIYAPLIPKKIELLIRNTKNVFLSSVNQENIPTILCDAHLLLLPLTWDNKGKDVISTATPGKLTEYLASGTQILVYAPKYSYISQYAKHNKFAVVVDEKNPIKLAECIKTLYQKGSNNEMRTCALNEFFAHYESSNNTKKIIELLNSV